MLGLDDHTGNQRERYGLNLKFLGRIRWVCQLQLDLGLSHHVSNTCDLNVPALYSSVTAGE